MPQINNFPGGFSAGLTIRGMPTLVTHPGKVFWVSNASTLSDRQIGGSDSNNGTFDKPFATLDYAVGQCLADRGDMIMVKPGHAETISSATALAMDVAGVAVVGLGLGNKRPTFTLDTAATATIGVSAANVSFKNVVFSANYADITSLFTLTTAKYFTVEDCFITATATNMNFLSLVTTNSTANAADGLTLVRNQWDSPDAATVAAIQPGAAAAHWTITDNVFVTGAATQNKAALIEGAALAFTDLVVLRNKVAQTANAGSTAAALIITSSTACSGVVGENWVNTLNTTGDLLVTAGSKLKFFDNKITAVADKSGFLIPAADS